MSINRHNYEEFFLMYVDNELQQTERLSVEEFVKLNADLAAELKMLQQATLEQEDFTFDQKELLYKQEEGISANNYEEYFVLSVDNELTAHETEEVEKFVLKHPELQDEFTLLKQTKLAPEQIEFKDKASLYRSEKVRRIVPIGWMKLSVAAAVIGLIAFKWIMNAPATNEKGNVAVAFTKPQPKTTEKINVETTVTQQPAGSLEDKTSNTEVTKSGITPERVAEVASIKTTKTNDNTATSPSKKKVLLKETTPIVYSPDFATNDNKPKEIIDDAGNQNNSSISIIDKPSNVVVVLNKNDRAGNSYATNAVYREIDTNEEDNSIYIGNTEINKNKLKGLFKKAAKILGKKSSEDDDDKTVQIAGFKFKSK